MVGLDDLTGLFQPMILRESTSDSFNACNL